MDGERETPRWGMDATTRGPARRAGKARMAQLALKGRKKRSQGWRLPKRGTAIYAVQTLPSGDRHPSQAISSRASCRIGFRHHCVFLLNHARCKPLLYESS